MKLDKIEEKSTEISLEPLHQMMGVYRIRVTQTFVASANKVISSDVLDDDDSLKRVIDKLKLDIKETINGN